MRIFNIMLIATVAFTGAVSCSDIKSQSQSEKNSLSETKEVGGEPWRDNQLMEASELAKIISDPAAEKPLIINIGPSGSIKGSTAIGSTGEKENLDKLKTILANTSKDQSVVIYCGCCPFKDCPNIRPAFDLLNSLQFTNHKLLNLSQNLKVDWIDKGFPMAE